MTLFKPGDTARRKKSDGYTVGAAAFQVTLVENNPSEVEYMTGNQWVYDDKGAVHDSGTLELVLPMGNTFHDPGIPLDTSQGTFTQDENGISYTGPITPELQDVFNSGYRMGEYSFYLPTAAKVEDGVEHPSHYNRGGIEVVDIINAYGLDFYTGSGIKYVLRSQYKEDELKDLRKAVDVLQKKIALLEAAE